MASFQHFQSQAEQQSRKPKFSDEVLSLSGLLEYADSAKKQSFDAVWRLQPLVKTYRDKVQQTSQAVVQAESNFEKDAEIPQSYVASLALVKESFAVHLASLEDWISVLAQKRESDSDEAISRVRQSGQQLETSLKSLSIPK